MGFLSLPTIQSKGHTFLLTFILLCATIIVLYKPFSQSNVNIIISTPININQTPYQPPHDDVINQTLHQQPRHGVIIPTSLQFNHSQILDFVIYADPHRSDMFSIFLSGRRSSWTWSEIQCFFHDSNTSVTGVIDRRSSEPFVVCPIPPIERKLIIDGGSHLFISLRIKDTNFPNILFVSQIVTVPIYRRERYNVSAYTMIKNKAYEVVEWIEYHLMIGIEHFYLYDHSSTDNIESFLQPYLERNIVTIVRWPYKPLEGHHWNMLQSASINHALKNFGPFNRWMGYFDIDEYFQIYNFSNITTSLSTMLDEKFPESQYPGGVQFLNCPISCLITQGDIITSRYTILFEKCRHTEIKRDCHTRTKLFIRPRNVPIMQNIHALQFGVKFASSSISASFAQFRHYHYGTVTSDASQSGKIDTSMDSFIKDLRERVITYEK